MVAGRQEREKRVADGGHATGETGRGFSTFQDANFFFESVDGRVGVSGINMAGLTSQCRGLPDRDIGVAESDAMDNGHLRRAPP